MADLQISNVVNISVAQTPAGLNAYNTSNIACFSDETPGGDFPEEGFKLYKDPTEVGLDFGTDSVTYACALAAFSQTPNFLAADGSFIAILLESSETVGAAITRTASLVQYFGIITTQLLIEAELLSTAAVIQALTSWKMGIFGNKNATSVVAVTGTLTKLTIGGFFKTRGILYIGDSDNTDGVETITACAAYAGRAFSVIFEGSNTTLTMNLKDLATIQPDAGMTQTIYDNAKTAGADVYTSIQGVPKVLSSGANKYFDQVYNLGWFVGALQIAGFNYLAETATKVPQTENGMDGLKAAYGGVCAEAVTNQYAAPGAWTSPTTFGNQEDLIKNIAGFGYYIWSAPIASQSPASRAARQAPIVQIALKEAGAIQSSTVIVNVNA